MSCELNRSITLERADWLVRFVRKNSQIGAIRNAHVAGETPAFMAAFIARNFDAIFPYTVPPPRSWPKRRPQAAGTMTWI